MNLIHSLSPEDVHFHLISISIKIINLNELYGITWTHRFLLWDLQEFNNFPHHQTMH